MKKRVTLSCRSLKVNTKSEEEGKRGLVWLEENQRGKFQAFFHLGASYVVKV